MIIAESDKDIKLEIKDNKLEISCIKNGVAYKYAYSLPIVLDNILLSIGKNNGNALFQGNNIKMIVDDGGILVSGYADDKFSQTLIPIGSMIGGVKIDKIDNKINKLRRKNNNIVITVIAIVAIIAIYKLIRK